jgi:hypothetical protein
MNEAERQVARATLIAGVSLQQLIEDLGGRRYLDLVEKHLREIGPRLPATIEVHRQLITTEERDAVDQILADLLDQASQPGFWSADAGDVCSSVSCDLHDALFPGSPDAAGVFNLFQLLTAMLANRAREDEIAHRAMRADAESSQPPPPSGGKITKMLGIAVSDCDARRISRRQLLRVFQEAIDNGDILEPDNEHHVVLHVIPLIDQGLLRSSPYVATFMGRMNAAVSAFAAAPRSPSKTKKPWWKFWS